jgi:hypothetical protein
MAKVKIKASDVAKKHLKIVGYLAVSSILAYAIGVLADRPEALYFAPVINYVIYAVQKELEKEGFVKAIKN